MVPTKNKWSKLPNGSIKYLLSLSRIRIIIPFWFFLINTLQHIQCNMFSIFILNHLVMFFQPRAWPWFSLPTDVYLGQRDHLCIRKASMFPTAVYFPPPGESSRRGERCLGGVQGFPPSAPTSPGPSNPPRSPQRDPWPLIPTPTSSPSCRRRGWDDRYRLANDVNDCFSIKAINVEILIAMRANNFYLMDGFPEVFFIILKKVTFTTNHCLFKYNLKILVYNQSILSALRFDWFTLVSVSAEGCDSI